jgi:hypothetical protein
MPELKIVPQPPLNRLILYSLIENLNANLLVSFYKN